jgi:hypothetical protein
MTATGILNLSGVLQGEATTVARNEASVLIDIHNLGDWATEQAGLIKKEKLDPLFESEVAEVVLKCRGDPKNLFVGKFGDSWLSSKSIAKLLRESNEIIVHFGAVEHEDEDGIPKSLFEVEFKQSRGVLIIPQYDGRIRTARPRSMISYDYRTTKYLIQNWFAKTLQKLWKNVNEEDDSMTVGTVNGAEVIRIVTRFTRLQGRR